MGRHRTRLTEGEQDGRRIAVVIGVVGLLAIGAVFGLWGLFASGPIPARATSTSLAARTADPGLETLPEPVPSETFVVPTPSYATPSLTVALGTLEPAIPDTIIDPASLPPAPTAPTVPTPPAKPVPPKTVVSNISLDCSQQGRRVRATLSFNSTAPVPVSVTAGARSESTTAGGSVHLSLTGDLAPGLQPTCAAVVNGQPVGPVLGH